MWRPQNDESMQYSICGCSMREREKGKASEREQCIIDIVHDLLEEVKFGSKLIEEVEN